MTHEYTVREYAAREKVTAKTVRAWIQKGALEARKTPGGRLRVRDDGGPSGAAVIVIPKTPERG